MKAAGPPSFAPREKATLLHTLAKRHNPAQLERKMVGAGTLTDADKQAVIRQAMLYRNLENEELLAPAVVRAWDRLEVCSSAPSNRKATESKLKSALSSLAEVGVLSKPEAEGIGTTYRQGWDDQERVQSGDLAASIASRAYRQAQCVALLAEVETLNAESDPLENGLSNEQGRYYQALRDVYTDNLAALLDEATLSGCGVSPDGLNVDPSAVIRSELRGGEVCINYAALVRQEQQKFVDLGSSLTLGKVDAAERVRKLAGRKARGSATPQEDQEFLTYSQAIGKDALASILGALSQDQKTRPRERLAVELVVRENEFAELAQRERLAGDGA